MENRRWDIGNAENLINGIKLASPEEEKKKLYEKRADDETFSCRLLTKFLTLFKSYCIFTSIYLFYMYLHSLRITIAANPKVNGVRDEYL